MKVSSNISKYLFALYALFVIFSDEMFLSYISLRGMMLESGMKAYMAVMIAVMGYILIAKDIIKGSFNRFNIREFAFLLAVLFLYLLTSFFYQPSNSYYWSSLLVFGSISVPACFIGMRLAREDYTNEMMKLLPLFVSVVAILVSRAAIFASMQGIMLGRNEEDVFSYQGASYYLAFSYAYCFYYIFFFKKTHKTVYDHTINFLMIAVMFACAVGCLVGGGRGAFAFLIVVTVYLIYRVVRRSGKGNIKYIALLIVGVALMVYLSDKFSVFESAGFSRVSDRMLQDDVRGELWKKAIAAFAESPIFGNGLGSVWWTVGYRSHNILSDLLSETGIFGTSIVLVLLIKGLIKLIKWSEFNSLDMFLLVVIIGSLVHDTFSGYWISSFKIFLVLGYVFGKS